MILASKHLDMGPSFQARFYDNMGSFAATNFNIEVSDEGYITIDGDPTSISYKIGSDKKSYTKHEAYLDFVRSKGFREHAKSRFWSVYQVKEQIL